MSKVTCRCDLLLSERYVGLVNEETNFRIRNDVICFGFVLFGQTTTHFPSSSALDIVLLYGCPECTEVWVGPSDPCVCVHLFISLISCFGAGPCTKGWWISKTGSFQILPLHDNGEQATTPSSTPSVTGLCTLFSCIHSKTVEEAHWWSRGEISDGRERQNEGRPRCSFILGGVGVAWHWRLLPKRYMNVWENLR